MLVNFYSAEFCTKVSIGEVIVNAIIIVDHFEKYPISVCVAV